MRYFLLPVLLVCGSSHPWSGWKEGSTVTIKTTVNGKSTEETWTVTKGDKTSVTVKIKSDAGESEKYISTTPQPLSKGGKETGKKKLRIDGTTFECTVYEIEGWYGPNKFSGTKIITKRWVCADAPTSGGVVKEEMAGVQANVSAKKSSFKITKMKATLRIGKRKMTCWVTESSSEEAGRKSTEKAWYSTEVPGRVVKRETTVVQQGKTTKSNMVVTAFEGKR